VSQDTAIVETLGLGVPTLEVMSGTRASAIPGYTSPNRKPPTVDPPEKVLFSIGGAFTMLMVIDDLGIVATNRHERQGDVGLARVINDSAGVALATDTRFVGSVIQAPHFGVTPKGDTQIVWALNHVDITSITIECRRKGSRVSTLGFSVQGANAEASGAFIAAMVDQMVMPSFRPKKVRDLPAFIAPVVTAIFHAKEAAATDPEMVAELQELRAKGWQTDPEDGLSLVVSFPDPARAANSDEAPANHVAPTATDEAAAPHSSEDAHVQAGGDGEHAAPGWYHDGQDAEHVRYWSGEHWTAAYAANPSEAPQ